MKATSQCDRTRLSVALPFFARRAWTSMVGRSGAAPWVPFDPHALGRNPSVTWIGHSSLLIRMDGATFLTDPVFSERVSLVSFVGPRRLVPPGVALEHLPPIDFALLSHDHYDHADLPSIRSLAALGTRFIVPVRTADLVSRAGGKALELDWWEHTTAGHLRIHCVPAQHWAGRSLADRNRRLWAGWVVAGPTRRFYYSGDTAYFAGFSEIRRRLGAPDLAALPIGVYEPAAMMRPAHLTPEEALQAALDVQAARVIGIHFGTFDLADEPLDEPPRRFTAEACRLGLDADRAWILSVGETRHW